MRYEVLCRTDDGGFETIGSVLLPQGADPGVTAQALAALDIYPAPSDELHWLEEDLAGAVITNSRGGTIIVLREVSAYRQRTGYRPNDHDALGWGQFMALDPYRDASVWAGTVKALYTNDEHSPYKKAALYIQTANIMSGTDLHFLAWYKSKDGGGYEMLQLPLNEPPSSILDMGRWSSRLMREVLHQMKRRPNDTGYNDLLMAASGAEIEPKLWGLCYYWYLEATDWSYRTESGKPLWTEPWERGFVSEEMLVDGYLELFERYRTLEEEDRAPRTEEREFIQVESTLPPPPVLEERAPRYPWSQKRAAAMRRAGLRPGYDYNGRRDRG